MNKLLSLTLALSFSLLITTQPPPPNNLSGNNSQNNNNNNEATNDWDYKPMPSIGGPRVEEFEEEYHEESIEKEKYCNVYFYYDGYEVSSEYLDAYDYYDYHGKFNHEYNSKIDTIYWEGYRCYCWIVVYQSEYFKGINLGLWTYSDSGSYDLSYFTTYDWYDKRWERWDTVVSSYSIYCY